MQVSFLNDSHLLLGSFLQGIIGKMALTCLKISLVTNFNTRSPIRLTSSWFFYGFDSARDAVWRYRLDNPSYRH